MTRVVVQVRCHDVAQKGRWVEAARAAGLELSVWLRRALDEQAALDGALAREEVVRASAAGAGVVCAEERVVSRLFEKRGV